MSVLMLRNGHVRKPRGGSVQWQTPNAAVLLVNEFFGVPASGSGLAYWSGAAWVSKPVKRWTGSVWLIANVKRWSGSAWVAV